MTQNTDSSKPNGSTGYENLGLGIISGSTSEGTNGGTNGGVDNSANNSHTMTSASELAPDIFNTMDKEKFYRHKIQPFPIYALDRLAHNSEQISQELKDIGNGSVHQSNDPESVEVPNDPFVNTFKDEHGNVKWHDFLHTVQNSDAYPLQQLSHDESESVLKSYRLEEDWKGDRMLNRIFHALPDSTDDMESESSSPGPYDNTKYRSKAVYWISENKKEWKPRLNDVIMTSSYIPLFFRVFTLILSCVALGLASRIVVLSGYLNETDHVSQQPSSIMAIAVQSVAILYLFYISYDEFTSQPLGLRNPQAKIRLIMCELLFVIFSSANLALSFNTLYDSRWVCAGDHREASQPSLLTSMCDRQRTLAAFLFIILTVWCITFTISIIRVVQMVSNREDLRH